MYSSKPWPIVRNTNSTTADYPHDCLVVWFGLYVILAKCAYISSTTSFVQYSFSALVYSNSLLVSWEKFISIMKFTHSSLFLASTHAHRGHEPMQGSDDRLLPHTARILTSRRSQLQLGWVSPVTDFKFSIDLSHLQISFQLSDLSSSSATDCNTRDMPPLVRYPQRMKTLTLNDCLYVEHRSININERESGGRDTVGRGGCSVHHFGQLLIDSTLRCGWRI